MAISATITKISKTGDVVRIRIGKHEYEFGQLADVNDFVKQRLNIETLHAIIIALVKERAPDLTPVQIASLVGHGVTIDLTKNSWGVIT